MSKHKDICLGLFHVLALEYHEWMFNKIFLKFESPCTFYCEMSPVFKVKLWLLYACLKSIELSYIAWTASAITYVIPIERSLNPLSLSIYIYIYSDVCAFIVSTLQYDSTMK